jgi:hypothetical protein
VFHFDLITNESEQKFKNINLINSQASPIHTDLAVFHDIFSPLIWVSGNSCHKRTMTEYCQEEGVIHQGHCHFHLNGHGEGLIVTRYCGGPHLDRADLGSALRVYILYITENARLLSKNHVMTINRVKGFLYLLLY